MAKHQITFKICCRFINFIQVFSFKSRIVTKHEAASSFKAPLIWNKHSENCKNAETLQFFF